MIKAIETRYKGYHFRSRLEARWAIFFDALAIEWEYEKEGFDLGELGWYLPDFWLPYPADSNFTGYPNAGHWVEIKGEEPSSSDIDRLLALSRLSKHSGFIIVGIPGEQRRYYTHHSGNHGWSHSSHPIKSPSRHDLFLLVSRFTNYVMFIDDAIAAAKAARFEHGEMPRVPTKAELEQKRKEVLIQRIEALHRAADAAMGVFELDRARNLCATAQRLLDGLKSLG